MEVTQLLVNGTDESGYDRTKEVLEFDQTKAGVKGLVDSGIVNIPRFFIEPPENRGLPSSETAPDLLGVQIPVIDLQGDDHAAVVEQLRLAAETWGFFQIVNHGVPLGLMEEMLEGIRRFHEQPTELKKEFYSRDPKKPVRFYSNGDLLTSERANWRDSIVFQHKDGIYDPEQMPSVCREAVREYLENMFRLWDSLCELLPSVIGVSKEYLESIECMRTSTLACNYYPPCPEPELTMGVTKHTDPSFLTFLLQDSSGGLQVFHQNQWVDVDPIPGALVVNLGDLLQYITNDRIKSVEHRVLARQVGARVSIACFFYPNLEKNLKPYQAAEEMAPENSQHKYKDVTVTEYLSVYWKKGLDGKPTLSYFKVQ